MNCRPQKSLGTPAGLRERCCGVGQQAGALPILPFPVILKKREAEVCRD